MSEAWHLQVQFLSVLFHDVGKVFVCESEIAYFLHVRVNQRYELVIALQYDALVYHCQGIEFVLYFFRIDILTVRTEKHVLAASSYEEMSVGTHGSQIARLMVCASGVSISGAHHRSHAVIMIPVFSTKCTRLMHLI